MALRVGVLAVADGADLDAEAAAGAVVRGDLVGDLMPAGKSLPLIWTCWKLGRRAGQAVRRIDLGADGGMGADQGALAALGAEVLLPQGQFQGDVALLVAGGARWARCRRRASG